jgi:hypothetical protein
VKQEGEQKAAIAGQATEAEAQKDGNDLVKVGYAYVSLGEVDKGIELIEKGIAKGGLKRPEDAKLRLGMAQLQSAQVQGQGHADAAQRDRQRWRGRHRSPVGGGRERRLMHWLQDLGDGVHADRHRLPPRPLRRRLPAGARRPRGLHRHRHQLRAAAPAGRAGRRGPGARRRRLGHSHPRAPGPRRRRGRADARTAARHGCWCTRAASAT